MHRLLSIFGLDPGLASPGLKLAFVNKVLLETATLPCLCVVYGCFHTVGAVLSRCDQRLQPTEPKIFTVWSFMKKVGDLGSDQ